MQNLETKLALVILAMPTVVGIPDRPPTCMDGGASGPNSYCNTVQVNQQSLATSFANASSVSALSYTSFVGFPGSTLTQQGPFASSFGNKYGNTTYAVTSANFSNQTQVDSASAPAQTASFPAQDLTQTASFPAQDPAQTASASAQTASAPAQTASAPAQTASASAQAVPAQTQVASFPAPAQTASAPAQTASASAQVAPTSAQDPAQTQVDSAPAPAPASPPTPTPEPTPTSTNVAQQNGNVGAIAGGVVGTATIVALVGTVVYCSRRPGPTAEAQGSASEPAQLVFSQTRGR